MKAFKRYKKPTDNSKYTMASWFKTTLIRAETTCICPTICNHRILNFIALPFFTFHWSSWTVYVQQWGLTQSIPPFGDKLRRGLILWPKFAASSNTVSEKWRQQRFNSRYALHLRADSHHDREKIIMYFTVFFFNLAVEHIANFWQQICMACSFDIPMSK